MKYLMAAKLISSQFINNSKDNNFFKISHNIGIIIITLGLSTMIIFKLMLNGMNLEITKKIYGINSQIIIENESDNYYNSYYKKAIDLIKLKKKFKNIDYIHPFINSIALLKSNNNIEGIFLKGYSSRVSYNYEHIKKYLIHGNFLNNANKLGIIISKNLSDKLMLFVNDSVLAYFITNPPRYRKLKVIGIFKTNISEIDENLGICNIELLQQIKNWSENKYQGYEIFLNDIHKIDETTNKLKEKFDHKIVYNVKKKYRGIFDWLQILKKNEKILFLLILVIICTNIISIILVQMFDRTYATGVLVSLGANNRLITFIFIFNIIDILLKGIFLGNFFGILVCLIQHYFQFIKLDPSGVYLDYAVIDWSFSNIAFLNILVVVVVFFITIIFINFILKIHPVKNLKFR